VVGEIKLGAKAEVYVRGATIREQVGLSNREERIELCVMTEGEINTKLSVEIIKFCAKLSLRELCLDYTSDRAKPTTDRDM
jgi:hypothetical protein